jgi:hypothetical protein
MAASPSASASTLKFVVQKRNEIFHGCQVNELEKSVAAWQETMR